VNWEQAHDYCCSIGMYLAHFPSLDLMKELYPILTSGNIRP